MDHLPTDTNTLAKLIAAKHDVLVQLRQLSRQQLDLIDEGDMSKLLVLLSAKQSLLGQLQKVERQLDPFRSQDPEGRRWESSQLRQQTRQTAERCEGLLGEIMMIEKQGESDLVRRRDAAAHHLQGVHTAARARGAYSQPNADHGRRLDLSSET